MRVSSDGASKGKRCKIASKQWSTVTMPMATKRERWSINFALRTNLVTQLSKRKILFPQLWMLNIFGHSTVIVWFFEKVAQTPRKWSKSPPSLPRKPIPPFVVVNRYLFRHVRTPTKRSRRPLHFYQTRFPKRRPEFHKNGLEVVIFNNVGLSSSSLDRRGT
ncbi:hypothetical protein GQ457_17G014450 [Hibiscus cannabinus]